MTYIDELKEFRDHLDKCAEEVQDGLEKHEYDNKYNAIITVNGKTVSIDLNADLYEGLKQIISEEIDYRS